MRYMNPMENYQTIRQSIGSALKNFRREAGFSRREFACQIGSLECEIRAIEANARIPSLVFLMTAAKILNRTMVDFLSYADSEAYALQLAD